MTTAEIIREIEEWERTSRERGDQTPGTPGLCEVCHANAYRRVLDLLKKELP